MLFLPDMLSNKAYRYEDDINDAVYRNVLACNGTVAAEHGIGIIKKQWLDKVRTPAEIALMKCIKQHLDPYNIMNPGKLLPCQAFLICAHNKERDNGFDCRFSASS